MQGFAMSSAKVVRQHVASLAANNPSEPLRHEDPETGALTIYSSTDQVLAWVPNMDYDKLTAWAKMPIFRVKLFKERGSYDRKETPYVIEVFERGEDLAFAIAWWRKRVSQTGRGFAVFEGGFDTTGVVKCTEAPSVRIDASNGEVEADGFDEIERKRELHEKRKSRVAKWAGKGVDDDTLAKIERAEMLICEKKERGQEYMLKGGWVNPDQIERGRDKGAEAIAKHNRIQKLDLSRRNLTCRS